MRSHEYYENIFGGKFSRVISTNYIAVYFVDSSNNSGTAEISKIDNNKYYFNRLFVSPSIRGYGISTRLLNDIIEIALEKDLSIVLEISPYGDMDFSSLAKFYKKNGFIEKGHYYVFNDKENNTYI